MTIYSLLNGAIWQSGLSSVNSNLDIETKAVKSTGRDSSAASNCHFADRLVEPAEDFRPTSLDILFQIIDWTEPVPPNNLQPLITQLLSLKGQTSDEEEIFYCWGYDFAEAELYANLQSLTPYCKLTTKQNTGMVATILENQQWPMSSRMRLHFHFHLGGIPCRLYLV